MTDTTGLATVGDVIAALSAYDPTTPLRVAVQPGYPMHHLLTRGGVHPDDAEGDGTPPTDPPMVWLVVGEQVGHLPESAADALRWSRTVAHRPTHWRRSGPPAPRRWRRPRPTSRFLTACRANGAPCAIEAADVRGQHEIV